ncbi:MAG: Gfo/Idh/MocA family oxidoreductase [Fimbriimonadaceae bacterium]|nr:Gfo/Idh/MocA family oxidoreductase [Fimbriimonadaceae bacterium]QYK55785.1 MAG: Gfo/Idh/MocA family oxidoreductase [Fimbriimonadaceae bacterium]
MDRREFLAGAAATGLGLTMPYVTQSQPFARVPKRAGGDMSQFADKPMETVRVGFIGVGARGSGHVEQMLLLEGVEVTAVCDLYKDWAERSAKACTDKGRKAPTLYTDGPQHWREMVQRDDVDIVVIATPWAEHVPMAVGAMKAGKHAFLEVPAATTVEGCWELVDTAEETKRHCMMMENVNYGRDELLLLNLCQKGVLGELLHAEAAYIHDLRWQMKEIERGTGSWRTLEYTRRNGNLYPTHGLGPVAHCLDVNRGDRFDYLSSVSSNARARAIYAEKEFPEGHPRRDLKFQCGDINTTIVRTVKGRTIMVQWDEQLPRPYTRHNLVQGTKGVWGGFPNRVVVEGRSKDTDRWEQGEGLKAWYDEFDHPLWTKVAKDPANQGGHGGMDFVMLWRIVHNLREGKPMDQSVYDAAAWSVVGCLSEWSVANRGQSVDVPDFSRGGWEQARPVDLTP